MAIPMSSHHINLKPGGRYPEMYGTQMEYPPHSSGNYFPHHMHSMNPKKSQNSGFNSSTNVMYSNGGSADRNSHLSTMGLNHLGIANQDQGGYGNHYYYGKVSNGPQNNSKSTTITIQNRNHSEMSSYNGGVFENDHSNDGRLVKMGNVQQNNQRDRYADYFMRYMNERAGFDRPEMYMNSSLQSDGFRPQFKNYLPTSNHNFELSNSAAAANAALNRNSHLASLPSGHSYDHQTVGFGSNLPDLPKLIPIEIPQDDIYNNYDKLYMQNLGQNEYVEHASMVQSHLFPNNYSTSPDDLSEDFIDPVGDSCEDLPSRNNKILTRLNTHCRMRSNGSTESTDELSSSVHSVNSENNDIANLSDKEKNRKDQSKSSAEAENSRVEETEITPQFDNIPDWIVRWRRKAFKPRACGICHKLARSSHFGGVCCDSCKAFFRRAVKNETCSKFKCSYDGDCNVIGDRRKACQSCRFKKCLSIGMKEKWVMRESNSKPVDPPSAETMLTIIRFDESMSCDDLKNISEISEAYSKARRGIYIPNKADFNSSLLTFYKILMAFTHNVATICLIHDSDWQLMHKISWIGVFLIRLVNVYDSQENCFPHCNVKLSDYQHEEDVPPSKVSVDKTKVLIPTKSRGEIFRQIFNLTQRQYLSKVDDSTSLLLSLIHMLDCQGNMMLKSPDLVHRMQEKLLQFLQKHLTNMQGPAMANYLYPLLLSRLADFREFQDLISDSVKDFPIL